MGCVRSKIKPAIWEKDEYAFLSRWSHCQTDNRIISRQSSSDISFLKVEDKGMSKVGPGSSCPSVSWHGEIPEILGFLLLGLFVLTVFRRWQNKQRQKSMKRALSQTLALQTVSSTVPYNNGPVQAWRGLGNRCLD